ncbi:hypothetical protein QZH41_016697 [Actinostola sp. cb2023]|nr:hypothetical protein QZH41_016697 [Actinostola sp. cb2023]
MPATPAAQCLTSSRPHSHAPPINTNKSRHDKNRNELFPSPVRCLSFPQGTRTHVEGSHKNENCKVSFKRAHSEGDEKCNEGFTSQIQIPEIEEEKEDFKPYGGYAFDHDSLPIIVAVHSIAAAGVAENDPPLGGSTSTTPYNTTINDSSCEISPDTTTTAAEISPDTTTTAAAINGSTVDLSPQTVSIIFPDISTMTYTTPFAAAVTVSHSESDVSSCEVSTTTSERIMDEVQDRLRLNQPKIVITECKSVGTSPTFSRNSSSSESMSDQEIEAEIFLKTDGKEHTMGMNIAVRTRKDQIDGADDNLSLVRITDLEIGSFAHGFGVRMGDIISKVNGKICGGDIMDIKEAFVSGRSDMLEMDILRRVRNHETEETELLKMTISNARRIGGTTEEELEIIKVEVGSNWSLSDNDRYYHQEERKMLLQFASDGPPWVVNDSNRLTVTTNLSEEEGRLKSFSFPLFPFPSLVEEHDLEEVTNRSLLFTMQVAPDMSGSNYTFQSIMDQSRYIGFKIQGITACGYAQPIYISSYDPLGDKERNVVFIEIEQ